MLLPKAKTVLSKSQIKLIQSLRQSKFRKKEQLAIAEGVKVVGELINSKFKIYSIFGVREYFENLESDIEDFNEITEVELKKISNLSTPNKVLALFEIPESKSFPIQDKLYLGLDAIRDPGNMGTIIRIADWYGVKNLLLFNDCVDIYAPKVVQSSMGSIFRINFYEAEINQTIDFKSILVTDVNQGENIRNYVPNTPSLLVIGNEANGVSPIWRNLENITEVHIPGGESTESLNAAVSTAICFDNLFRNLNNKL